MLKHTWFKALLVTFAATAAAWVATALVPPLPGHDGAEKQLGEEIVEFNEDLTGSLAGSGFTRFFRLKLAFRVAAENLSAARSAFDTQRIIIRDRLNLLLSSKTEKELYQDQLKHEIMDVLTPILFPDGEGELRDVFYNQIVVQ